MVNPGGRIWVTIKRIKCLTSLNLTPTKFRKRTVVLVVAGLIERDGRILIGQRKRGDRHAYKWEFPGGKVEQDEDPKTALARELTEELSIHAKIGPEILRYEHLYPNGTLILLIFCRVESFTGEPKNNAFEQILWEQAEHLPKYDFLDGDTDFVRRLARREF